MARVVALLVGVNAALGIMAWFGVKFTVRRVRDRGARMLGQGENDDEQERY